MMTERSAKKLDVSSSKKKRAVPEPQQQQQQYFQDQQDVVIQDDYDYDVTTKKPENKPGVCWKWIMLWLIIVFLMIVIGVLIYFIAFHKEEKKTKPITPGPMDNPLVVARFQRIRELWYILSVDASFLFLIQALMTINSNIVQPQSLSNGMALRDAYQNLDRYVKTSILPTLPPKSNMTLIFADGILFYDSSLTMDQTYYIQNELPRALSIYTLGSPLKDHNTLPENFNALMIHCPSDPLNFLGMPLTHPLYEQLSLEGFGFIERISSNMNTPTTYLSRFLKLSTDPTSQFMHGCVLTLDIPVSSLTTTTTTTAHATGTTTTAHATGTTTTAHATGTTTTAHASGTTTTAHGPSAHASSSTSSSNSDVHMASSSIKLMNK